MVEKARNLVREVADDYPLWVVGAPFLVGFLLGLAL